MNNFRQSIQDLLTALPEKRVDALKKLFWSELNYDRANSSLRPNEFPDSLQEKLVASPLLFATAGDGDGFHVIYCHLNVEKLVIGVERRIVSHLLPQHPYGLFLFSDKNQTHWHFVNVKYEQSRADNNHHTRRVFRRLTIGPEERLRTATERIALLDTATLSRDLFGVSPLIVQQRHDDAFNVEAVTERFFDQYKNTFKTLKDIFEKQTKDKQWAHEYALQFLNRLMFLYYVQRKRWLGGDPEFLRSFWEAYKESDHKLDTFVSDWLNVLFFEAFNNQFQAGRQDRAYLPAAIRDALAMAPYLNGGLFMQNQLDKQYKAIISDGRFKEIFGFFENYNFTISEDTPLDQEVAVDPEMIGKVYESLVNISEEADERNNAGIFYTPRVEIDLMCRLALVDHLANHLGAERKNLLYETIFAFEDEDKHTADEYVSEQNLWDALNTRLRDITVLDPACGSGSFLVGMLHVLDDLRQRANYRLGYEESAYERKKDIIRNSLYGVDVMRWAVHVAELRLWLQLVIDTDLAPADLKFRPLLPNLSFKIRQGDSLVQELGGVNLAIKHGSNMPPALKGKLSDLKAEKRKFYNNNTDEPCKYRTEAEVRQAELFLFREIVDTQAKSLHSRILELEQKLRPQTNLFGEVTESQMKLTNVADRAELDRLQSIILDSAHNAQIVMRKNNEVPFVWDIAFVEVFEDEKGGFDVVVGNPPYVRQEMIRDPLMPVEEANKPEAKKIYKAKLANSIYAHWSQTFKQGKDIVKWKLDAKSDLYVYFFFQSFALMNGKGSFCFITSNSWLDVGYGKDLQEFLLTRGKVNWILDNQSRRSFASADVNTVISLFGKPQDSKHGQHESSEHIARFVMFTVPFEYTLSPVIWQELEEARLRKTTPEYHIYPSLQSVLFANGLDPENEKYIGDKWGGKYLRAPEIFWKIFEKGKFISIEPKIGDVVTISWSRQGQNSDIMTRKPIGREKSIPVLKSPRDFDSIIINPKDVVTYLYLEKINQSQLIRTQLVWDDIRGERHICRYNPGLIAFTHNFHGIRIHDESLTKLICALLNSTLTWLFIEVMGRRGLGGGGIRILVQDLKVAKLLINPINITNDIRQELIDALDILAQRPVKNVTQEIQISNNGVIIVSDDRRKLDNIVFTLLGLSSDEGNLIYSTVLELVKDRVKKADTFKSSSTVKELIEMEW